MIVVVLGMGVVVGGALFWKNRPGDSSPPTQPKRNVTTPANLITEGEGVKADEIESVLTQKAETVSQIQAEELRLAQHLAKTFPRQAQALVLLGNVNRHHGNLARGIELYEQALAMDPQQAELYEQLGEAYREMGQTDRALSCWQKGVDVDPNSPNLHWLMAKTCIEQGKNERARDLMIQACETTPNLARNHYYLGQTYLQLKAYEQAKAQYNRAIELSPNHYNTYFGLANACMRLKERDQAMAYMAQFKTLKQKYDDSRQRDIHANEIETVRKRSAMFYLKAYGIYKAAGHADKAESLIQRACQLDPDNSAYLENLATHYYLTGRVEAALDTYKKVLKIDPNQPLVFVNIGKLTAEQGNVPQAVKVFETTVKHFPNYALGYAEFARLCLRLRKNPSLALTLAQRAVTLDPAASNYMLLSWAHNVTGNRQAALEAIQKAIDLEPDNQNYRGIRNQIRQRQ